MKTNFETHHTITLELDGDELKILTKAMRLFIDDVDLSEGEYIYRCLSKIMEAIEDEHV